MTRRGTRGSLAVALATLSVFLLAATASAATRMVTVEKRFGLSTRDNPTRFEVNCPSGTRSLGGGFRAVPPVDASGNGAYPLAFERLGAQDGWHITATNIGTSVNREVSVQAFCATYKGNVKPVEKVLKFHLDAGQTKSFTAKCPGKKKLISGGFLTSQFFDRPRGGVYVTTSRAASPSSWRITATAVAGGIGGDVNPIAYCYGSKKTLLREVASPPAAISGIGAAATTTATCPGGLPLAAGGFETTASGTVVPSDLYRTADGAWSATGVGFTGAGDVTGYAYCLAAKLPTKGHKK